jgi:ligand-binding sensor domain-containing protein
MTQIISFNTSTKTAKRYPQVPNSANMLFIDQHQLLVAGVSDSLFTLNTQTGDLTKWLEKTPGAPINAQALFVDSSNTLWLGASGKGLISFNKQSQTFDYYNTSHGLLSGNILAIVEDDHRNLWLGTPVGLSRFNLDSKTFTNFDQSDGLRFAKIREGTAIKMDNGFIAMGSSGGIVMFNPQGFCCASI